MPGYKCGVPGPAGQCMECMCGQDGLLACGPCGGTGATGGGTAGTGGTTGTMTCNPGDACMPGYKCGVPGPAGQCMECMCGQDGLLACGPCGGGTGGTTGGGTGGSGAPMTGPCQVSPMPSPDVGLPCGVREFCPDGIDYRVNCDGTTGACMCFMKGMPTASTPTMMCSSFDPIGALVACGFPDGKI
jgi:hypothetical protein